MEGPPRLILSGHLQEQILWHARKSQPNEAVGLLGGTPDGVVTVALPLPNIAVESKRFVADPFEQFCALRHLESEGLQLLAIYHSHPAGGAHPSEEDLEYAKRWTCAHLIIAFGMQGRRSERLRAFCCVKIGAIEQVEIPIVLI
jgi:[CysO sulfur-carrier protein]-S-L-cysteine hydrolase